MDRVEEFNGARIQHGPAGSRVYVMHAPYALPDGFLEELDRFAAEHGYGKIFAKVHEHLLDTFISHGYVQEARVPDMYRGIEAGCFLARYPEPERREDPRRETCEQVLSCSQLDRAGRAGAAVHADGIRLCTPDDAEHMARFYRRMFESYPFPIHDAGYIRDTMQSGDVRYFCVEQDGAVTALSSAEMDRKGGNAEMTDFATLPDARGKGYAGALLHAMERAVREEGICTAYTIARAVSRGMNTVFARAGYRYGGRLVNNTPICGRLESMNVWYRRL